MSVNNQVQEFNRYFDEANSLKMEVSKPNYA